jgi:hypothetical protein
VNVSMEEGGGEVPAPLSVTQSNTNVTQSDLGFKLRPCGERPATNQFRFYLLFIVLACLCVCNVHHTTRTSMPSAEFEPVIPASERP